MLSVHFIICLFVLCVCVGVHAQGVRLWSSEDDVQELGLLLSSPWKGPGDWIGVVVGLCSSAEPSWYPPHPFRCEDAGCQACLDLNTRKRPFRASGSLSIEGSCGETT